MDDREALDPATAKRFIAERRSTVQQRLAGVEDRLGTVRTARSEWTDEEHDPEGFTLTHEWSHAEGSREEYQRELDDLDRATARVDAATYGVCETCGLPIPSGQLERRPARRDCVACADRGLRERAPIASRR
jgi:DnaK suppressor protein